jgi:hypothetical protein
VDDVLQGPERERTGVQGDDEAGTRGRVFFFEVFFFFFEVFERREGARR